MSAARRVLVTDFAWPSLELEERVLAERADAELVVAAESDDLVALARDVDAILVNWRELPAEALEAASRCVVVSRYGVGVDNIPVARAAELGIVVTNVPDFCAEEVADHAMALLLAAARRIVTFADQTRAGGWDLRHAPGITRLSRQTLGIVGFGRGGRCLATRARGFGMEVVVWTPRLRPGADLGELTGEVEIASNLEELLGRADYVSLHAPVTEESRRMIDAAELEAMKSTAILINVSRGALVDQEALLAALKGGVIGGAGLDVLEREPPIESDRELLRQPNVTITPHAAFYSEEAIESLREQAVANVVAVLAGRVPEDVVDRRVLEAPGLRMPTLG